MIFRERASHVMDLCAGIAKSVKRAKSGRRMLIKILLNFHLNSCKWRQLTYYFKQEEFKILSLTSKAKYVLTKVKRDRTCPCQVVHTRRKQVSVSSHYLTRYNSDQVTKKDRDI